MTPGELKFALLLESHLNSLPDPEYRQLVVECLMVVSLVTTSSTQLAFGGTLVVEHIIHHAHHLFLQDQVGALFYVFMCLLSQSEKERQLHVKC